MTGYRKAKRSAGAGIHSSAIRNMRQLTSICVAWGLRELEPAAFGEVAAFVDLRFVVVLGLPPADAWARLGAALSSRR